MPDLFIIAGPNGAGKTTASFTVLPEMLNIREFVNADEIARGLSPFSPEGVAIEAGRLMLRRIDDLMKQRADFAFETTLATRSFINIIREAKAVSYTVTLIFYWLEKVELAIERVRLRVSEGGHHIPEEVIRRRYYAGLRNLITLYMAEADACIVFDSTEKGAQAIARSQGDKTIDILQPDKWTIIQNAANRGR